MFRVCISIIAYIISFLSHSNQLPDQAGTDAKCEPVEQFTELKATDSIDSKGELRLEEMN